MSHSHLPLRLYFSWVPGYSTMFVASAVKTKGAQFNFTTRFTLQSVERQCSRHKPLQTPTQILHIRERPRELCWKKTVWSAPCLLAEVTLLTAVDRFVIFVRSCHAMLTGPLRQCISNPRARCVRSNGSMTPRRLHGSCSKPPDVFPFQIFQAFRPLLGWKLKPSIPKHAAAVDLSTAHVRLFWSRPRQSWAADSEPLDHREFAPPTVGPALRHTLRCSGWGCVHLSSRNTWEIVGKLILCLHTPLESAGKLVAVKLKQTQVAQLRRRCHWRGEARDVQAGAMPCYKLLQRMRSVEWNQEEHTKEQHKMKCCHARYVRVGHATSCTDSQNNMKQLCSKYTFLVFRMSHQVPSARRISYWSKALNWFPSTFWKGWTAHSSSFAGMKCFQPLFGVNSRPTWSRIKAGTGRWSCISLYQSVSDQQNVP